MKSLQEKIDNLTSENSQIRQQLEKKINDL